MLHQGGRTLAATATMTGGNLEEYYDISSSCSVFDLEENDENYGNAETEARVSWRVSSFISYKLLVPPA